MQMFNGITMSKMVVNEVLFDKVETKTDDVENQSTKAKLQQIDENIQKLTNNDTKALDSLNSILSDGFLNALNENEKGELRKKIGDLLLSHMDDNDYSVKYHSLIKIAKSLGMDYFSSREEYTKNLDILLGINGDINDKSIQLLEDGKTTNGKFYDKGKRVETAPDWVNTVIENINKQETTLKALLSNDSQYKDNEGLKKANRLLENIQKIIENPVESNVQLLQQYIFDNLDDDMKDENNGNLKKTFMDKNKYNKSTQKFDGKFGETTLAGLNKVLEKTGKYIDSFNDQPSEGTENEPLNDIKVKESINLPEGDTQIISAKDLLDGTLPDGAKAEFKKDEKGINLEDKKPQEVTVVVKDKENKVLGEIIITATVETDSDGNKKINLAKKELGNLATSEATAAPEATKPTEPLKITVDNKEEQHPVANIEPASKFGGGVLYCMHNGTEVKNVKVDINGDTEYLMQMKNETYKVKLDQAGNLKPLAINYKSGAKILIKNNPSCIAYLQNKIPATRFSEHTRIAWNPSMQDYVIRSYDRGLTIEPVTLDGNWVSKKLGQCLAFENLTNFLRGKGNIHNLEFKNNHPDLKLENDGVYVRIKKGAKLDNGKKSGRWFKIDLSEFGLDFDPEALKKFIKYNNREDWEDNWDKKSLNKGYTKVDLPTGQIATAATPAVAPVTPAVSKATPVANQETPVVNLETTTGVSTESQTILNQNNVTPMVDANWENLSEEEKAGLTKILSDSSDFGTFKDDNFSFNEGVEKTEENKKYIEVKLNNKKIKIYEHTDNINGLGYKYAKGYLYMGNFKNGNCNGKGTLTWPDGDKYEGDFVDNKRTGKGTYTRANGNKYEGDFVDNKRTGNGTYMWTNGNKYEGEYLNDEATRGTMTWTNGDKYEGNFVHGERTGNGTYTRANGNKYEGEFENDNMTSGKITINSTSYDVNDLVITSEGDNEGKRINLETGNIS